MILVCKQALKHLSKTEYLALKEMAHSAKSLYNEALYKLNKNYEENKSYIGYYEMWRIVKMTHHYRMLQSSVSQQVLRALDKDFQSFFALLKLKNAGKFDGNVNTPKYKPKKGYCELRYAEPLIRDGYLTVQFSKQFLKTHKRFKIKVPSYILDKHVKQVVIIPRNNARFFEVQYLYEEANEPQEVDKSKALAIDFGIDNFCTCVTNQGWAFIIDGKKLKSYNCRYNQEISKLSSVKDKQHIKGFTKRMYLITRKRNNRVNDYINKSAKIVIDYCLANSIGNLVVGYNKDFQFEPKLGKRLNRRFVTIPFGKMLANLKYRCKRYDIAFHEQEESYTSKASAIDGGYIPKLGDKDIPAFSGKRISRGIYKTKSGKLVNADVNGAMNILRKCNLADCEVSGNLGMPKRIRVA